MLDKYLERLEMLQSKMRVHPDDPGEPGLKKQRMSVTPEEGMILSSMVAGKTVLEIGTGLGISTLFMSESAKHVYTIDIDKWVRDTVYPVLREIPNITCMRHIYQCPLVDVVFIDALHSADAVEDDTKMAMNFDPDTIIYHDAKMLQVSSGVARVFPKWKYIDTYAGIGVVEVSKQGQKGLDES